VTIDGDSENEERKSKEPIKIDSETDKNQAHASSAHDGAPEEKKEKSEETKE
jgi:hypothetical protein